MNRMKAVLMTICATSLFSVTACTTPHDSHAHHGKASDGKTVSSPTEVVSDLSKYSDQKSFCPKVTEQIVKDCQAQSGTLQKYGLAQCYTCTVEYADAGKVCSSSSDCEGKCYNYGEPVPVNIPNQTGQCASDNVAYGCHQAIENGMATEGMLCID